MRKYIAAIAFVLMGSGFAAAADTLPWKTVAGWEIRVDPSVGFGCFLSAVFEGGTNFRIGLNRDSEDGYMIIWDPTWRSLELGKDYRIAIQFDAETPWNAPAHAIRMGDSTMLDVSFDDSRFLTEFARKQSVELSYNGKLLGRLSLRGSAAASAAMIDCQESVDAVKARLPRPSRDPFADEAQPVSSDPFAE